MLSEEFGQHFMTANMNHATLKTSTQETIMREYALTLAQPSLSTAIFPMFVQCLKTARVRRAIRKTLAGGGICPATGLAGADLQRLLALPLSCDLTAEIERIKFFKARGQPEGNVA